MIKWNIMRVLGILLKIIVEFELDIFNEGVFYEVTRKELGKWMVQLRN